MAGVTGTTGATVSLARRNKTGKVQPAPELVSAPSRMANEVTIARLHSSARRLVLPAIAFIGIIALACYFTGRLPMAWENSALPFVAITLTVFLSLFPFLFWLNRVYVITTRRVILKRGFFVRVRHELLLTRGYDVVLSRGPLQTIAGSGTISINTGNDQPTVLRDVPQALLVQATLADLMEYSQHAPATKRQQDIAATRRPFDP